MVLSAVDDGNYGGLVEAAAAQSQQPSAQCRGLLDGLEADECLAVVPQLALASLIV
jgi:hypothetical protein